MFECIVSVLLCHLRGEGAAEVGQNPMFLFVPYWDKRNGLLSCNESVTRNFAEFINTTPPLSRGLRTYPEY